MCIQCSTRMISMSCKKSVVLWYRYYTAMPAGVWYGVVWCMTRTSPLHTPGPSRRTSTDTAMLLTHIPTSQYRVRPCIVHQTLLYHTHCINGSIIRHRCIARNASLQHIPCVSFSDTRHHTTPRRPLYYTPNTFVSYTMHLVSHTGHLCIIRHASLSHTPDIIVSYTMHVCFMHQPS